MPHTGQSYQILPFFDKNLTDLIWTLEGSACMFYFHLRYREVTPFGPLLWQAEGDTELTLSASPAAAVGQKAIAMAKRHYSTVPF